MPFFQKLPQNAMSTIDSAPIAAQQLPPKEKPSPTPTPKNFKSPHLQHMEELADAFDACRKNPSINLFSAAELKGLSVTALKKLRSYSINIGIAYGSDLLLSKIGLGRGQNLMQAGSSGLAMIIAQEMSDIQQYFDTNRSYGSGPIDKKGIALNKEVYKYLMKLDSSNTLMPSELRSAVALFDKAHLASPNYPPDRASLALEFRQGILKSIPRIIVDISHQTSSGDQVRRGRLDKNINHLIEMYPPKIHQDLRTLTARMRANCFIDEARRAQVYLYGRPGIGKTHFAKSLAETVGVPLIEIDLGSGSNLFEKNFYTDPTIGNSSSSTSDPKNLRELLGDFQWAMISAGVLNPVILIDEGGDKIAQKSSYGTSEVNSTLKRLLDPDLKSLSLEPMTASPIDFTKATIIVAGNYPITDEALRSRIKQIEFPSLPTDAKRLVVAEELKNCLKLHSRLDDDLKKAIAELVNGSLDAIMRLDEETKNPGVRVTQEVVRDLVAYVREQILSGETPTVGSLETLIESAFRQRLLD